MEKEESPVIVVGIPRSGTSNVTRILCDMGYYMGLEYAPSDWRNPDGFFEDINIVNLNEAFVADRLGYMEWRSKICSYFKQMMDASPTDKWGFKDTRLLYGAMMGSMLEIFESPTFVLCKRDPELVKKSLMKCFGYSQFDTEGFHRNRTISIERLEKYINPIVIDYKDKYLAEGEILDVFRKEGLV